MLVLSPTFFFRTYRTNTRSIPASISWPIFRSAREVGYADTDTVSSGMVRVLGAPSFSRENALLATRYILNLDSTYCPGDRWRISWLPIPISGWPWSQQRTFSGRCRYSTTRRASTVPQGLCRHSLAPSKTPLIAIVITCCCARRYSRILLDCGSFHDGISLVFSARSRRCTNVQCARALRRRRGKCRGHLVLLLFPKTCLVYGARFCE